MQISSISSSIGTNLSGLLMSAEVLGVITGAVIGSFISGFFVYLVSRANRRLRRDELIIEGLRLFGGRTQVRSVGIAILEGNWRHVEKGKLSGSVVPVICNQLIYLISESDSKDAQHEIANFERMVVLLEKRQTLIDSRLRQLMRNALNVRDPQKGRGIELDQRDIDRYKNLCRP